MPVDTNKLFAAACARPKEQASTAETKTNIAETLAARLAGGNPGSNLDAAFNWSPLPRPSRRLALLVHGEPRDLGSVRRVARVVHEGMQERVKTGQSLSTRVIWFLDDCAHSSNWGTSFPDVADETSQAHCYQGGSRYQEALNSLVADQRRLIAADPLEKIDGVLMLGSSLTEKRSGILQSVKALADHGTRFFGLQARGKDGFNRELEQLYAEIADTSKGIHAQIYGIDDARRYIPAIAESVFDPESGIKLLGANDPIAEKLRLAYQRS